MLDELVKQALVGTGRVAPSPPRADGPLGEALAVAAEGAGASPEARLLAAAAVLGRYEACGRTPSAPQPSAAAVAPAPADAKPECSRRAGDLLGQLLGMTNTPAKQALLREWLDLAALARRRAPHPMLPSLLEYGAAHRPLRQSIADAADARGAWLMGLNPRWRFAAGEADGQHELPWDTGVTEQRVATLRRLRGSDPAAARRLVESTWKQDGADERARFVEQMRVGLGADDEPFLEAALDDRSKQVRAAAVELLARLPGSAFVARMIARADPLLKIAGKGKPAKLEVTLPPAKFDPAWARDGMTEKPDEPMGQRQWRLVQILSVVPPAYWSAKWGLDPESILVAAAANEHGENLLRAWTSAAVRQADSRWGAALLRRLPDPDLLRALPNVDALALMSEALERQTATLTTVAEWLEGADFPLDRRASAAALGKVAEHVLKTKQYDYRAAHVLDGLALRIPAELHDELAAKWVGDGWEQNRSALDKFFGTLAIRRDLQREFTQ